MNAQADPTSFLMSSGTKSFKFEAEGDTVKGTIVNLEMQQQRDFKTNELKVWDDGKPMMQLRLVLATDLHENDDDNGQRAVYVRGQMQQAVREAIKNAGATSIEEGGTLAVKYEGDGTASNPKFNAPKLYRAEYKAPEAEPVVVTADSLI